MSKILVATVLSLMGYPVWSPRKRQRRPAVVASAAAVAVAPVPRAFGPEWSRRSRLRTSAAPAEPVAVDPAVKPVVPQAAAKTDGGEVLSEGEVAAASPEAEASTNDEPTAEQIIVRVQELYDGTTSFQANFRQVFRHRLNPERSKEATGVVYLQKPGKMRWEYHDPERKLIVSDGTTLWAYEPEDNQVFEQSLSDTDLPSAVSFLLGSGSLASEFDVRLVEDGTDTSADRYVLELRPKTPSSQYSRLLFVVNRADYQVVRTVVVDHSGNTNSIEFAGVTLNGAIPASQFRFVRPKGARVSR